MSGGLEVPRAVEETFGPYRAEPRRKLPAWAKHLRHLRPLKACEVATVPQGRTTT